jgi:hypothetical protein
MMSCDTVKEFLSHYMEDTLDTVDRREVQGHLAQCSHCKKKLDQIQFLTRRIQSTAPLKTSADFEKKLHARIAAAAKEPANVFPIRRVVYGLTGAAAVAAASFLVVGNFMISPPLPGNPTGITEPPVQVTQGVSNSPKIDNPPPVRHERQIQQCPVVANQPDIQDSVRKEPTRLNPEQMKLVGQER